MKYKRYAAKCEGRSERETGFLVTRQLMGDLLEKSGRRSLSDEDLQRVGAVLLQGPTLCS
ncbi:hypothetical protein [Synechococcus sp. PCC 7335]|uniref:hypothetical protein n=1 Tax=Synechococcus sp. (strain ATCC 29403 / PCC 7335) TaxID=91464 RepID=UPI0012FC83E9|nr:hypothetical protein [Synechococcus sp. PCC 7335]